MKTIAIDLDRTIAMYGKGDYLTKGKTFIGEPIKPMIDLVKKWHNDPDKIVIIFTARDIDDLEVRTAIQAWCYDHLGFTPHITNRKHFSIDAFLDDRSIQVKPNTGEIIGFNFIDHEEHSAGDLADKVFSILGDKNVTEKLWKLGGVVNQLCTRYGLTPLQIIAQAVTFYELCRIRGYYESILKTEQDLVK